CAGLADAFEPLAELGSDDSEMATGAMLGDVEVTGDGFARITRICPGRDPASGVVDEANGKILMIAGFTDAGLDPILFGRFDDCVLGVAGQGVTLDIDFAAWVGVGIGLEAIDVSTLEAIV